MCSVTQCIGEALLEIQEVPRFNHMYYSHSSMNVPKGERSNTLSILRRHSSHVKGLRA